MKTSKLSFLTFLFIIMLTVLNIDNLNAKPNFIPPADRKLPNSEKSWPLNHFISICWHDVNDDVADQRYLAVRTSAISDQFAWLKANGYQPVSVDQILTANKGGTPLPPKAVLLTFDDGYSGFYHKVLPLLKAYNWHAVWAPVGKWIDTPSNQAVDFGGLLSPREQFATWQEVKEAYDSGLVEIASHTYNKHYGILANPQGNVEPAATSLQYFPESKKYETPEQFKNRLEADIIKISEQIQQTTGKPPRVWIWPYGEAQGEVISLIQQHGYQMALTLEDGLGSVNDLYNLPRLLIANNPELEVFAQQVIGIEDLTPIRVVQVDLDYLYDTNPEVVNKNLDELVQRIYDLNVNTIFLQAFADPYGDGNIKEVYFPNRWLPMRADLFNRVVWQLASRARHVKIYAWMPVLSFNFKDSPILVQRWNPKTNKISVNSKQYHRLSPFNAENRKRIIEVYEDLARAAPIKGILFHDDAVFDDFEDASSDAIATYVQKGFPGSIKEIREDPETFKKWSHFKTQYLIDFTLTLAKHVKAIRGGHIKTARNMYILPLIEPESEAWFAQNYKEFLDAYDWVVPMVMPRMEKIPLANEKEWLTNIVQIVANTPKGLEKTVFELQAKDWNIKNKNNAISTKQLVEWIKIIQINGALNFGYYPDDFIENQPQLDIIRPAISSSWESLP